MSTFHIHYIQKIFHMWFVNVFQPVIFMCPGCKGLFRLFLVLCLFWSNCYIYFINFHIHIGCGNKYSAENTDGDYYCESWAITGECQKNPSWMLEKCQEACGSCPGRVASPGPAQATVTHIGTDSRSSRTPVTESGAATRPTQTYTTGIAQYLLQ